MDKILFTEDKELRCCPGVRSRISLHPKNGRLTAQSPLQDYFNLDDMEKVQSRSNSLVRREKTATHTPGFASPTLLSGSNVEPSPPGKKGIDFLRFPLLFSTNESESQNPEISAYTSRSQSSSLQKIPRSQDLGAMMNVKTRPVSSQNAIAAISSASSVSSIPTPNRGRKLSTLASFVEGISNRLAKTSAQIAVLHPGQMNPMYIHGGTSFGKTHLLEGICSEVRAMKNRRPALFMTAEQFTTAFIESLRHGAPGFRNKFRGISMLLIDDIPFFAGKNSTQTEFIHTLDTLKNQGVQLVFTGDRPLRELTGLRPELLARLEAGAVCGIDPPERDTLLRIFQQMVRQRNIPICEEVCRFVVSRLNTNARQLSGALNRLHTIHLAQEKPITVSVVEEALDDLIRNNRKSVRLADIEKVVCETFGLVEQSLQSPSRAKQVSYPRMLAMWLARKYTRSALSEIGKYFGNRSHSTVVSARKKVDAWLNENAEIECGDHLCSVSELVQKVERTLQTG